MLRLNRRFARSLNGMMVGLSLALGQRNGLQSEGEHAGSRWDVGSRQEWFAERKVLGLLLVLLSFRSDLCCSTFSADDVKLAGEENGTGSVRSRTAAEQVERAMERSWRAKQEFLAVCKTIKFG